MYFNMSFRSAQGSNALFNNLTLTGNLVVNGNIDISGNANYDDVTINDTLMVDGVTNLNNNVDISGNLRVDGLNATVSTSFIRDIGTGMSIACSSNFDLIINDGTTNSDLIINENTTNSNVIIQEGNLTLSAGDFIMSNGNATLSDNLTVDGTTNLNIVDISENLSVSGASTFTGLVTANAGIIASGSGSVQSDYYYQNGANDLYINNTNPGSDVVININQAAGGGNVLLNTNCIDSNVIVETGNLNIVAGDIYVTDGGLTVSDASTFAKSVTFEQNITAASGTITTLNTTNLTVSGTLTASNIPISEIVSVQVGGSAANVTGTVTLANNPNATTNYAVFPSIYYGFSGSGGTYTFSQTSSALSPIIIGSITATDFMYTFAKQTGQNVNIFIVFLVVYNLPGSTYPKSY